MKKIKFSNDLIFPVIYNEGFLFKGPKYYLWKDNKVIEVNENLSNKEVYYPETLNDVNFLNQSVEIIFQRIQLSQIDNEKFIDIMVKIKNNQENIKKQFLKLNL